MAVKRKARRAVKATVRLDKERTVMADERTLLAYIRTALSIFVFAIFVLKFFPEIPSTFHIFLLIVTVGVVVLVIGFVEYFNFKREAQ